MTRMKPIGLAASHLIAGIIGVLLATRGLDGFGKSPTSTPSTPALTSGNTQIGDRSGSPLRASRSLKDWRGSEHQKAWNALRGAKLNTRDRIETQRQLLRSWAKVDLAAAIESALDEAWDNDGSDYYDKTGPLLDVFSEAFAREPNEAWELIQHGGLGIGSAMLRHVWIQSVGPKHPLLLASLIQELSWRDRDDALNACASGAGREQNQEIGRKLLDQLAALPNDIVSASQLAFILSINGESPGLEQLRNDILQSHHPDDRIAAAKSVLMGRLLARQSNEEIASSIEGFPANLKQEILGSILDLDMYSRSGEKLTGLLDLLVAENAWGKLGNREVSGMLLRASREEDARQIADWVTTIPFRKETTEMFHRGVETYLRDNMETSKDWIAGIPSAEWRDRAYAEYSQQALNAKKDPSASRWALDKIQDTTFKAEAERWRSNWEKRNAPKKDG